MIRTIRFFARGGWALAGLAGEPLRSSLRRDVVLTIEAVCREASHRRGWPGVVITGIAEWRSIAAAILRTRLGHGVDITVGPRLRRHRNRESLMIRLAQDLRQALRGLLATRGVMALAALTLALGIGVNTAVFSVLDSLLFRPVPYADAERLARLWTFYEQGKFAVKGGFTPPLVMRWREQTDLFARVEAAQSKSFVFEGQTGADMVLGSVVTPGLFATLGVQVSAGRAFAEGDGRTGSNRHAIISDRFWRQRIGRDQNAIGRPIVLDGDRYDIVGIMPAAFQFPDDQHEIWLPFDVAQPPAAASFEILVRIRDGLVRTEAEARVVARGVEVNRASGGDGTASAQIVAIGSQQFDQRTTRSLAVLGGAVVCLLLIVCANVANLTVARALSRSRDLAVRVSLGASRWSLFRVALAEHAVLGAVGAALAFGVATLAIQAVNAVMPAELTMYALNAVDIDGRALAWLVTISIVTVLTFGVPPAIMASRASVASVLGRESRGATGSVTARRLRSILVVAEVSLSIVLLVGAALMTRSLLKLQAIDIGIDTNGLISLQVAMPAPAYADPPVRDAFTNDLLVRLRRHPNVIHASAGTLPPTFGVIAMGEIEFDDRPGVKTKTAFIPVHTTWPGYFQTAGIRLLEGRELREDDVEGAAVVSQGFAARHWPGRSAVGAKFKIGKASWRTIVGVAAEVHKMGQDDDSKENELYFPHDQVSGVMTAVRVPAAIAEYRTLVVRTRRPAQAARELAALVHEADGRVIVSKTTLVATEFADAIARPRIVFLMMSVFAGVGLVLAAAGLYGVLSHLVSQRRREIGIRLALGASPRDIGRLVMVRGFAMVGVGLALGLVAALGLVRLMRTLLYEVEPGDPLAVAAVVCLMAATAALAAWRPARRAMQFDPVKLLREE